MTSKIKIIIAEDFEIIREDFCELINAQKDMEVVGVAATEAEIIKLAHEVEWDIILMDIEMDSLRSGINATEKIHYLYPNRDIIFLTAHDTDEMIITAMATGAVDYIIKSVEHEVLLEHIRRAYEGNPILEGKIQTKIRTEFSRLRQSEQSLLFFINSISKLTHAERELIKLFLRNKKINEIAEIRCVEVVTVKTQIKSILKKFGVRRTKEITKLIHQLNIAHLFENA